jgi:hypothetical protein
MKSLTFLFAVLVCIAPVSAQTFPTSTGLPLAIPDLSPGVVFTVPVAGAAPAGSLSLDFTFGPVHTWYGDLRIVVTNPAGASVAVKVQCGGVSPAGTCDSSDVGGPYSLIDSAGGTFAAAALAAGAAVAIAPGAYKGDNALNPLVGCQPDGAWTVTFSDHAGGDVGTVTALALTFGPTAENFCVYQVAPGALVNLVHFAPAGSGITYTNAAVLGTPAAVPAGWWYGLDIPLPQLLDEFTNPGNGTVFIGSIPAGGVNVFSVSLPPTFNFQIVGVHFDSVTGLKTFNAPPVDFTVL